MKSTLLRSKKIDESLNMIELMHLKPMFHSYRNQSIDLPYKNQLNDFHLKLHPSKINFTVKKTYQKSQKFISPGYA